MHLGSSFTADPQLPADQAEARLRDLLHTQFGFASFRPGQLAALTAWRAEGGADPLSALKQRLPEEIGYGEIRCVLAAPRKGDDSVSERP